MGISHSRLSAISQASPITSSSRRDDYANNACERERERGARGEGEPGESETSVKWHFLGQIEMRGEGVVLGQDTEETKGEESEKERERGRERRGRRLLAVGTKGASETREEKE